VAAATDTALHLLDARTGEQVGMAPLPKHLRFRILTFGPMPNTEEVFGTTSSGKHVSFSIRTMVEGQANATPLPR
jgi:hypothetical protein